MLKAHTYLMWRRMRKFFHDTSLESTGKYCTFKLPNVKNRFFLNWPRVWVKT